MINKYQHEEKILEHDRRRQIMEPKKIGAKNAIQASGATFCPPGSRPRDWWMAFLRQHDCRSMMFPSLQNQRHRSVERGRSVKRKILISKLDKIMLHASESSKPFRLDVTGLSSTFPHAKETYKKCTPQPDLEALIGS